MNNQKWVLNGEPQSSRDITIITSVAIACTIMLAITAFVAGVHYGVTHGALPFPGL